MAILLDESFEVSALGGFTTNSGTTVRDTSNFFEGVASLDVNAAGTAKYNQLDIPDGRILCGRFMMFWDADISTTVHMFQGNLSGNDLSVQLRPGLKMRANIGGTASADSAALSTSTWYLIDCLLDSSTGTYAVSYRINGVAQTGITKAVAAADMTLFRFGIATNATGRIHLDAVRLTDQAADYPIGGLRVVSPSPMPALLAQ